MSCSPVASSSLVYHWAVHLNLQLILLTNLFKIPSFEFAFAKDGIVSLLNETIPLNMHTVCFKNIVGLQICFNRKFYSYSYSITVFNLLSLLSFMFILSNNTSITIKHFAPSTFSLLPVSLWLISLYTYFSKVLDKFCFYSIKKKTTKKPGSCQMLYQATVPLITITTSMLFETLDHCMVCFVTEIFQNILIQSQVLNV